MLSVVSFWLPSGNRGGEAGFVWREKVLFKATQGFWGMPRGGVPMKDVPSGDTR